MEEADLDFYHFSIGKMNSTYTQFVASKRMGICDPIHQLGMWGDFKGNGFSTPPAATMILEVEKSLDNPMTVIEKTLDNQVYVSLFMFGVIYWFVMCQTELIYIIEMARWRTCRMEL